MDSSPGHARSDCTVGPVVFMARIALYKQEMTID